MAANILKIIPRFGESVRNMLAIINVYLEDIIIVSISVLDFFQFSPNIFP